MSQKDVIYIDVEDDITAIIGKVKGAKEKIVALVPPKRIGVLQSAVNLRLLVRAADNSGKKIVLITNNAALTHLAGNTDIPVAKNLQTPPKMPKTDALLDEDDDVIDGNDLPVGDHAGIKDDDSDVEEITLPDNLDAINVESDGDSDQDEKPSTKRDKTDKKRIKVPDFGSFRKKLLLGGVLVVVLGVFLYWANVVAPRATIVVSAKTSDKVISVPVTLGDGVATDGSAGTLQAVVKKDKDSQSVDFVATGKKNLGATASGTVRISTDSIGAINSGASVPANTQLQSSDGLNYLTTEGFTPTFSNSSKDVSIVAAEPGEKYNGASGEMSGAPGAFTVKVKGNVSGGTDKMATVVTKDDIAGAKDQLKDQDTEKAKSNLKNTFGKNDVILDGSFNASGAGDPVATPGVDQETPSGKATLKSDVSYSMMGVSKVELNQFLDAVAKTALQGSTKQRVYDNGVSTVRFSDFKLDEKTGKATATLAATIQVGPSINDDDIKDQSKGRRSGEVIDVIKKIDGVSDVEVKTSPFWVGGVPSDTNKITVEFKLLKNE